ncbi:regulator of MON1-CCZ1 complex isoform X3 [Solanum pennellii]|uniref:Regulator of MON1-CCZ1 complex isoform X3 n=1 Tax=Solanum pennellii TaxID=28526 RepID=A0ABM1V6K4_SOLPN|nr:regulator of MON1-CCZ1 complex isoform X3 [Solanum pennellii]
MSAQASSSQPSGFGSSGALSHVYIQYPPLRCTISGARNIFYDEGTKQLIVPTSDQVFCWKTTPFNPNVTPSSDQIGEGPVLSIRYSLDLKLLAVQRSTHEVQIQNRESGDTFSFKCRSGSERILGFFWTDSPTCDIVFVKTSGLELFSCSSGIRSLQLVETKKLNVSWYVYTHESRLVLLATGMQCKNLTGYQISSVGIVRLPRFDMAMAKSEVNSKPVLAAEDVYIVTVYGRIYCLQLDKIAMQLHCYRFYRDAVIQQGSLPVYSNKIAVSVVDNVLLVHQVDAKVVIIYDIFADSQVPVSAPLPLLVRGFSRANAAASQLMGQNIEGLEGKDSNHGETIIYADEWVFLVPDLICDTANGVLWKIHLDLEAISSSSSEVQTVLEFLQRRKLEANKAKQLCLAMARTIILERRPVPMVARAIDVLVNCFSLSIKTGKHHMGSKVERSSTTSGSNVNSALDESISQADTSEKSPKQESGSGTHDKSIVKSSSITSESEDNVSSAQNRGKSVNVDLSSSEQNGGNLVGTDVSGDEAQPSVVRLQAPGSGSTSLRTDEQQESLVTSAAVSPDDLCSFVFVPVEEEMAGDSSYLVAIIVEFLRRSCIHSFSANLERLKVPLNIYVLMIQLLARNENYAELGLFIMNKIIEPSKEVAMQLLASGRHNFQTRKLGLDMLRELALHHDYVLLLVQDGYYLEALRYARKTKYRNNVPSWHSFI